MGKSSSHPKWDRMALRTAREGAELSQVAAAEQLSELLGRPVSDSLWSTWEGGNEPKGYATLCAIAEMFSLESPEALFERSSSTRSRGANRKSGRARRPAGTGSGRESRARR